MRRSVFLCAIARIRAETIYKRRKICYNGGMKALREHKRTAHDVSRIAISVALISVCSWISIPVGASVKYTVQLLAVFVCCASLGAKRATVKEVKAEVESAVAENLKAMGLDRAL